MGWPVQVVDVTGSTNADLGAAARSGERGPRFLVARAQTAGRGRLDRSWQSPPGASLALSLLWAPGVAQQAWTWLPMVVGLGVLDGLRGLGVDARLKWPNDVVVPVAGRSPTDGVLAAGTPGTIAPDGALTGLAKLAGILVEGVAGPAGPVVVAGVGLNLDRPGVDAGARAVSVAELHERARAGGAAPDFEQVVGGLPAALERRLLAWQDAGGDVGVSGVRADYVAACSTLGRRVRALTPGGERTGLAVDVAADGSLVVQGDAGTVLLSAGDVEHVR